MSSDIKNYLLSLLSSVSTENPLTYLHTMYDSVSPAMIREGLSKAKEIIKKENGGKEGKVANCFLCIGGDNINEMFMQGIIAALLWLPKYIDDAVEMYDISRDEVEVCKKVLEKVNLPKIFDAYDITTTTQDGEKVTKKVTSSSLRHYASFLTAIIKWCTTTCTDIKMEQPRSNLEVVRYLSAVSINSFPSIPWCSYFCGSCRTKDGTALAEKLSKSIKFDEYMSSLSLHINQPRFIVSLNNSPLVGVSGHPLSPLLVGTYSPDTDTTEWMGLYAQNTEFERLCTEKGFNTRDVRDYVLGVTLEKHKRILQDSNAKFHEMAKFIETNELLKFGLEKYHAWEKKEEENYEM